MPTVLADLLEDIKSIEPLPQVATRVMQLSGREDVVPRDLVDLIQTDPGVTAKVLKLCNSALYGFQREIASLPEAGNLLGVQTLVNLVLTSCTGRYLRDYGYSDPEAAMRLWEQSIATAFGASALSARTKRSERNRAYTAGLLENIGHVVLMRFVPERREEMQRALDSGLELIEAEKLVYGMNHAELGARLARKWDFPDVLIDAIRTHHNPEAAYIDPDLASLCHVAEMATHTFHFGEIAGALPQYRMHDVALARLGLDRDGFLALEEPLREELAKAKSILEIA